MKKKNLDHLAMPLTSIEFARQALGSAHRRWLQMRPGKGPVTAPREDAVSHYSGTEEDVILGGEPQSPLGKTENPLKD